MEAVNRKSEIVKSKQLVSHTAEGVEKKVKIYFPDEFMRMNKFIGIACLRFLHSQKSQVRRKDQIS